MARYASASSCHGHLTTAPPALGEWRDRQIAGLTDPAAAPHPGELRISDDDLRRSIEPNQLRLMDERGIDMTVFSPRASFMAHHVGDFETSARWAALCNELCHRVSRLYPERFVPAAVLPQSPGVEPATCIPELTRCVEEYGAVALNLNPDPSGGHWTAPPLSDRSWYPGHEKMAEYDVPAMVHVSTSVNPAFHTTGARCLNADATVFMQLVQGDLRRDFPSLRLIIPHGGGAVPYRWGRFRGLAMALGRPPLEEHVLGNVFFDTCVCHQPGIDLLPEAVPARNILFASEVFGAVRDVDPATGHHCDDTRRYAEAAGLSATDLAAVQEANARAVYPRRAAPLRQQGR